MSLSTLSTGLSFDLNNFAAVELSINLASWSNQKSEMDLPFQIRLSLGD